MLLIKTTDELRLPAYCFGCLCKVLVVVELEQPVGVGEEGTHSELFNNDATTQHKNMHSLLRAIESRSRDSATDDDDDYNDEECLLT